MPASLATTAIPVRTSAGRKTSIRKLDLDETSSKSYAQQLQEHLCRDAVRVIDLFREWDTDESGAVSKAEFRAAMPHLGLEVPRADMDALFESWDPDGSNSIELKELSRLLRRPVQLGKKLRAGAVAVEVATPRVSPRAAAAAARLSSKATGGVPIAGARPSGRRNPIHSFAEFEWMSTPYSVEERLRAKGMRAEFSAERAAAATNRPLFNAAAGTPFAPRATGAFARFRYDADPSDAHEARKKDARRADAAATKGGAFRAGGCVRGAGKAAMQARGGELRAGLRATLRADWTAFHALETDARGCLVASFYERGLEGRAADLKAYMNRLIDQPQCSFFGVARDNARWGRAADEYVVYALRPPWVRNDPSANVAATVGSGRGALSPPMSSPRRRKAAAAAAETFSAEQVPQTLPPMQLGHTPAWSARGYADRPS